MASTRGIAVHFGLSFRYLGNPRGAGAATNCEGELGTEDSYFGVWSLRQPGDTPPRWKFGGPHGIIRQPRGVTLDPAHKNVIVTDKRVNAVLTWYFPEMFWQESLESVSAEFPALG